MRVVDANQTGVVIAVVDLFLFLEPQIGGKVLFFHHGGDQLADVTVAGFAFAQGVGDGGDKAALPLFSLIKVKTINITVQYYLLYSGLVGILVKN